MLTCFYISQTQKRVKFTAYFAKTGPNFHFLSFNTIKKYFNVLEMFNFNLKTCFQIYPISSSLYDFFSANVSDFIVNLLLKTKTLSYHISIKNKLY